MTVAWKSNQKARVAEILAKYPPRSNQCEQAAGDLLPVARQIDPSARAARIDPTGRARFLMTKISLGGEWWRYHVTTEVTDHYVDCLTGPPGTSVDTYFTDHYQHDDRDAYRITSVTLREAG